MVYTISTGVDTSRGVTSRVLLSRIVSMMSIIDTIHVYDVNHRHQSVFVYVTSITRVVSLRHHSNEWCRCSSASLRAIVSKLFKCPRASAMRARALSSKLYVVRAARACSFCSALRARCIDSSRVHVRAHASVYAYVCTRACARSCAYVYAHETYTREALKTVRLKDGPARLQSTCLEGLM